MTSLYFILSALVIVFPHCQAVNVGVMYSSNGTFGFYGCTVPTVFNYWLDHRRQGTPVNGIFCDIHSNAQEAITCTQTLVQQNVTFIIAPETVLVNFVMQQLASLNRLDITVLTGVGATPSIFVSNGKRKYKNLFGVMTPSEYYFETLIPYFYIHMMKNVAILSFTRDPDYSVCKGAMDTLKDYEGDMILVYNKTFSTNAELDEALEQIQNFRIDILIVCYLAGCEMTINNLAKYDINPKALALFECANYIDILKPSLREKVKFIYTPIQWDYRLKGKDYTDNDLGLFPSMEMASARSMYHTIEPMLPCTFNSVVPSQLAVLYVIDDILTRCPNCTYDLSSYAQTTYMRTFYGLIRFNDLGENDGREITLIQVDNNYQAQIISPISSATSTPVVPSPTYRERLYQPILFRSSIENAYLSALILISLSYIFILVAYIQYRHHTKLKALSARFLFLSFFSLWLWLFAPYTWKPVESSAEICPACVFMWTVPPFFFIMPHTIKTIRIRIIFASEVLQVHRLNDAKIGLALAIASLFYFILPFSLMFNPDVLVYSIFVNDINRPALNQGICLVSASYITTFIVVYAAILLLSSILAYQIRMADNQYNDARAMGYLFYNLLLMASINIVCHFIINDTYTLYGLRTFSLLFYAVSSTIIYIERIMATEVTSLSRGNNYTSDEMTTSKGLPGFRISKDQRNAGNTGNISPPK